MLKLYKRTVVISISFTVFFIILSLICEFFCFSHNNLLFTYASGIACSLIVVIITVALQYLHEYSAVIDRYADSLRNLATYLICINEGGRKKDDAFYDEMFHSIDDTFEKIVVYEKEWCCFKRKTKLSHDNLSGVWSKKWVTFKKLSLRNRTEAIEALVDECFLIELIDKTIQFLPDNGNKKVFQLFQEWLNEPADEVTS